LDHALGAAAAADKHGNGSEGREEVASDKRNCSVTDVDREGRKAGSGIDGEGCTAWGRELPAIRTQARAANSKLVTGINA